MDLGRIATVEVTSEDPNFPIESVFGANGGPGWRTFQQGSQQVRLICDQALAVHRQQWNFSPRGFARELEEYEVNFEGASGLKLVIKPDTTYNEALATLAAWRGV